MAVVPGLRPISNDCDEPGLPSFGCSSAGRLNQFCASDPAVEPEDGGSGESGYQPDQSEVGSGVLPRGTLGLAPSEPRAASALEAPVDITIGDLTPILLDSNGRLKWDGQGMFSTA